MDFLKTLIVSVAAVFSIFNTHGNPGGPVKSPNSQVLGETTAEQMTVWKEKVKQVLGCDYTTTCREFCAKPENTQRCTYFFSHYTPQGISSAASSSASIRSSSSSSKIPYPTLNPTQVAEYIKRRMAEGKITPTRVPERTSSSSSNRLNPELRLLTATSPSELKVQLRKAYVYIQQSNAANKDELIKRLNNEYTTALSHEENHIKVTAGAVSSAMAKEKEKVTKDKEQFLAQAAKIRDEKKKQIVQLIDTKIIAINYRAVEVMSAALYKLSTFLTSLNKQIFTLQAKSPDVINIQIKSLEAQSLITEAQTAVLNQANKMYILPISSDESKLKGQIAPVVTLLQSDLVNTHKAVIRARDAVNIIYQDVYQLRQQTASPSAY